jgi:hypothetical protein
MAIALIVTSALAGPLAGYYVAGLAGAILGIVPPTVIGVWQSVKAIREAAALREELRPVLHPTRREQGLEDEERRRRDLSARIAAGGGSSL